MTGAELGELCLGLPGAREEFPFRPQLSVFTVAGKCSRSARWQTSRCA
jgi:predicted DNA-binding protein (MmcQ/YjbR family)